MKKLNYFLRAIFVAILLALPSLAFGQECMSAAQADSALRSTYPEAYRSEIVFKTNAQKYVLALTNDAELAAGVTNLYVYRHPQADRLLVFIEYKDCVVTYILVDPAVHEQIKALLNA